jgi:uncharacterized protein
MQAAERVAGTDEVLRDERAAVAKPAIVIDADRHVVEPLDLWKDRMPEHLRDRAPRKLTDHGKILGFAGLQVPAKGFYGDDNPPNSTLVQKRFAEFTARGFSPDVQVEAMDVDGIDVAVLFTTGGLQIMGVDGLPSELTTAACHVYNDWLRDFCDGGAGRLVGVGLVDPRDVDGACKEARRCIEDLSFAGVMLRPNPVNGKSWHDPVYSPLWSELERLDVPVCFHEGSTVLLPQVGPDRFGNVWPLWHAVSHPVEQQLAITSMVLGGVLEKHPGLRCGFLECGASWLPYYMWRLDEHAELDLSGWGDGYGIHLDRAPSEYIAERCFVSTESDEGPVIATLRQTSGFNVMWASDFPHPDAKYPGAISGFLRLDGLDADFAESVLHTNPLAFYGQALTDAVARRVSQP